MFPRISCIPCCSLFSQKALATSGVQYWGGGDQKETELLKKFILEGVLWSRGLLEGINIFLL